MMLVLHNRTAVVADARVGRIHAEVLHGALDYGVLRLRLVLDGLRLGLDRDLVHSSNRLKRCGGEMLWKVLKVLVLVLLLEI